MRPNHAKYHLVVVATLCLMATWPCDATAQDTVSSHYDMRGKKLVTIGDSQTAGGEWQRWLVEWLGIRWSMEETAYGIEGHRPMAVGGTWILPSDASSISLRAADARYYAPDIIIIYAGQNDVLSRWVSAEFNTLSPPEQVASEVSWRGEEADATVTTLAAYKGMIERLRDDMPDAHILLMTHVPILCQIGMNPSGDFAALYPSPRFASMDDVMTFELSERYPKDEVIRALGDYYNLPVIDLWHTAGITNENATLNYGAPAGDCTQVHLNEAGNKMLANAVRMALHDISQTWHDSTIGQRPVDHQYQSIRAIYRPDGVLIRNTTWEELPRGLYIVDRRKLLLIEK